MIKTITMIVAVLLPTAGQAQSSRTYYDASGRVSGRSITDTSGAVTIYDSTGKVSGRATTGTDGTTTVYGADGRRIGSSA